jgi:hypothetical protein
MANAPNTAKMGVSLVVIGLRVNDD